MLSYSDQNNVWIIRGLFTFVLIGEGDPNSYVAYMPRAYKSDCSDYLEFLQWGRIKKGKVKSWWIILDSALMVNIFWNKILLTNIKKARKRILVHCNGGKIYIDEASTLGRYGELWLWGGGIVNITSLARVIQLYPITLGIVMFEAIINNVHLVFKKQDTGLYIL